MTIMLRIAYIIFFMILISDVATESISRNKKIIENQKEVQNVIKTCIDARNTCLTVVNTCANILNTVTHKYTYTLTRKHFTQEIYISLVVILSITIMYQYFRIRSLQQELDSSVNSDVIHIHIQESHHE